MFAPGVQERLLTLAIYTPINDAFRAGYFHDAVARSLKSVLCDMEASI